MKYFTHFPLVQYNGHLMHNILVRGRIQENVKNYSSLFYPYTQQEHERIEHIAFDYYSDPHADWMIYLANDIVDPYYEVFMNEENFARFIKKKYGSISNARNQIVAYRNNWANDFSTLSTAAYDALAAGQKKYWSPVLSVNGVVSGYERKKRDYTAPTNKIQSVTFTTTGNTFTVGERIQIQMDTDSEATVSWANTTHVIFRHISGDFSSNTNYVLVGQTSSYTSTANAETLTTISTVIPSVEQAYFSSVSAYDAEVEKNESRKEINLVQNGLKGKFESELKRIMRKS